MSILYSIEDEEIVFRIPLDGLTAARLLKLAEICEVEPAKTAASLLHDILADDERENAPAASRDRLN